MFKANPPEYIKRIEAGKEKLISKDLDGALADFTAALALDPQPSLAHYYIGHVSFLKKVLEGARGEFEKGLNYNKIHYKCLVGLYDLLMELKLHKEAYEVVKKISQYFPANPKRLAEVLRLAILTQSYADVERYYGIFCNIDERNDLLTDYICAALIVCGKHYVKSGNRNRAIELFQKAVATSAGRTKFLREIVQTLVDGKMAAEAAQVLKRYPPGNQKGKEYLLLDFQVANLTRDATAVLNQGRDLVAQGVDSEKFYEIMLTRALEAQNTRIAESMLSACGTKFPAIRDRFRARSRSSSKKPRTSQALRPKLRRNCRV